MRLTKQIENGVFVDIGMTLSMDNCIIERSQSETAILYVSGEEYLINNCTFTNNSGNQSVIMIHQIIIDQHDHTQCNNYNIQTQSHCDVFSNCLI